MSGAGENRTYRVWGKYSITELFSETSYRKTELGFTLSAYKQVLLDDYTPIVPDRNSRSTVQPNLRTKCQQNLGDYPPTRCSSARISSSPSRIPISR